MLEFTHTAPIKQVSWHLIVHLKIPNRISCNKVSIQNISSLVSSLVSLFLFLSDTWTYLAMVGTAILGHGTLAVHQEAVPAALLRQRRLVSLSDEGVQLSLLAADGLHKLIGNTDGNK